MLFIVAGHYVFNSGLLAVNGVIWSAPTSLRALFVLFTGAWGKTGINCFVLITGYFMCKSRITVKKFMKLLLEVMFYKILITSVFWLTGYEKFTLDGLFNMLIPVKSLGTGFTSAFLVFYLSIPFINILTDAMDERQHIKLLLLLGFSYVFLGTVPGFSVTMNYFSWFIVVYLIAAYIRLYPKEIWSDRTLWGVLTGACILLSGLSIVVCAWVGKQTNQFFPHYFVTDSNTVLAVATAVCSFLFFKNLNIQYSRFINRVAASTFGVLLIHANNNTMRIWLWSDLLDNVGHYSSKYMPLHMLCSVLGVFTVCTIIDMLRIQLFERPFFRFMDKHWHS